MRKIVGYEGKFIQGHGIVLTRGVVKPPLHRVLPVCFNSDWLHVVALATDFQRDTKTGELSFDFEFTDDAPDMLSEIWDDVFASLFLTEIKIATRSDGLRYITQGRVQGITLMMGYGMLSVEPKWIDPADVASDDVYTSSIYTKGLE